MTTEGQQPLGRYVYLVMRRNRRSLSTAAENEERMALRSLLPVEIRRRYLADFCTASNSIYVKIKKALETERDRKVAELRARARHGADPDRR
jgi:hypothetical protein